MDLRVAEFGEVEQGDVAAAIGVKDQHPAAAELEVVRMSRDSENAKATIGVTAPILAAIPGT